LGGLRASQARQLLDRPWTTATFLDFSLMISDGDFGVDVDEVDEVLERADAIVA